MSDHVITLYEVKNAFDLRLDYRLVGIEGCLGAPQGDNDLIERNRNLLAKQVAIRAQTPVALVRRGDARLLAIPAQTQLTEVEYCLTPSVVALKPQDDIHCLRMSDKENRHIALKFLEFSLRGPLRRNPDLWASTPRTFMQRRPVNFHENGREVDLFEGFHFHLRFFANQLFLGLNLIYKYIDTAWLVDKYTAEEMRYLKMRHLLYHFGNRWYPVQLLDVLNTSIGTTRFQPDGAPSPTTIFHYTRAENNTNPPPWIQSLNPDTPAITYRSPGRDKTRFAAAALAKLIHRTDEVSSFHRRSIKAPSERFKCTRDIAERFFSGSRFGGTELDIAKTAHRIAPTVFPVPALEFGQGQRLTVSAHGGDDSVRIKELPAKRMSMLLDPQAGFAITSPLDAQYLLIPQSLNRDIAADFRKNIEGTVREFLHSPYKLDVVLYDDRNAHGHSSSR